MLSALEVYLYMTIALYKSKFYLLTYSYLHSISMRLFGEIGGATLEGAGSKVYLVGVAVKISRKTFETPGNYCSVTDFACTAIFLHIAIDSSSACVRYLRRYHL